MIRPVVMAALLALALAPADARAQVEAPTTRWLLEDARGSFCIWYLVDPALAPKLAPKGTQFAVAGSGAALPPMVARVIRDEPQFASWIPAAICVGRYGVVRIDGEEAARAREGRSILVLTHSIAAIAPMGQAGAGFFLLELATDDGNVVRLAELSGLRVERREVAIVPSREGGDDALHLQVEKARLVWSGHRFGEPRVETTQSMSFGLAGMRTSSWRLEAGFATDTVQPVVGQLRIEGKDDLAKALKASPIRAVGPFQQGGRAEWLFSRGSRR